MYVNNIRSPNYFIVCWLLVLGIVFFTPRSVCASVANSVIPGDDDWRIPNYGIQLNKEDYEYYPYSICPEFSKKNEWWYSDYNKVPSVTHYEGVQFSVSDEYLDSLPSKLKLSDGRYCVPIVLSGRLGAQVYPNAVVKNVYISKGDKISLAVMGTYPGEYFEVCQLVNGQYVNNDNTYYYSIDGIYLPKSADVEGFEPQYDISDLKSYPIDSVNVTFPVAGSNIKTNGRFVNVAIKGKIGIDCTDDIAVTKEDLGKLIRNNFRYSFKSDKENFENVSYLGPVIETSRGESPGDDILDILQVLGNDYPIVKGEQIKIAPLNDNFTIGVSGNAKDWTNKKYYNFVINTALYVGENDGEYDYKLRFKVPVGFGMNITYKTITVNYSLSRGSYVDDDFDGIDDNTNEIIPGEEIEIINPSTSTPSLPSDDGLDDGLQVVNILKDIYKDFCHGVNGSVNILKSFFSVVNSTVKSVCDYSQQMVISFSNIFGFMPSPIPQLITMSLAIMIFVSVLGFIKK